MARKQVGATPSNDVDAVTKVYVDAKQVTINEGDSVPVGTPTGAWVAVIPVP